VKNAENDRRIREIEEAGRR